MGILQIPPLFHPGSCSHPVKPQLPSPAGEPSSRLEFCTQGSATGWRHPASPPASVAAGLSRRHLFWGKRGCRGGLGAQAADGTSLGSLPAAAGARERAPGRSCWLPLGCWQPGRPKHTDPRLSACHQGHNGPFQPWSPARKGQGAASVCTRRGQASPRGGSGEQRECRATIAPASPSPGSSTRLLAGLFPCETHAWLRGLRGRERGARRREPAQSVFPLCATKEFRLRGAGAGAFQHGAAPASLRRHAAPSQLPRARSRPGRVSVPRRTGSSREREWSLARPSQGFKGQKRVHEQSNTIHGNRYIQPWTPYRFCLG